MIVIVPMIIHGILHFLAKVLRGDDVPLLTREHQLSHLYGIAPEASTQSVLVVQVRMHSSIDQTSVLKERSLLQEVEMKLVSVSCHVHLERPFQVLLKLQSNVDRQLGPLSLMMSGTVCNACSLLLPLDAANMHDTNIIWHCLITVHHIDNAT